MISPPPGPKIASRAATSNCSAASISASAAALGVGNVLAVEPAAQLPWPKVPNARRHEMRTTIAHARFSELRFRCDFMIVVRFIVIYLLPPPRPPPPREPPPPPARPPP